VIDAARQPWREVRSIVRTGSTNADLLGLAEQGEASGLVLVALEQSDGRGRLGRSWQSPPGAGLTFSVLLRSRRPVADLGPLPLLTGLAIVRTVDEIGGPLTGLKWPNDVMIADATNGDRKLAGVLAQHSPTDALVVGIGLNTGMTADQRPIPAATSLLLEGVKAEGRDHDVLLAALLGHLADLLAPLIADEPWPADVLEEYRARCLTIGVHVRVQRTASDHLEGAAVGIDASGALLVRTDDGAMATVTAGDVLHVR